MAAVGVNREGNCAAVGADHAFGLQVHGDAGVSAHGGVGHEQVADFARQTHREDAVLKTVIVENVREIRRNDARNSEIQQRPRCVLA